MYVEGLVSVIIPTYKRADKLMRAIDSVCNQSYDRLEILIVDDNEAGDEFSMGLEAMVEKIEDSRVKLIHQARHVNGAAARNVGIKSAKGEYIAFLDDDDYWAINKVERQVEVLSQLDPSFGGVSTLFKSFLNEEIISCSLPYEDGYIWEDILLRNTDVTTCSILLRRECLDETGYFDESLVRHQEIQLLSYFTFKYKLRLIREYLLYVDAWGENNPDVQKMIKIKRDFFRSVRSLMDTLPRNRQKRVHAMHQFELAYVCAKEGEYREAIKNASCIFLSPVTLFYAIRRVVRKIMEKTAR